jgi:hypothetical protein
MQSLTRRTCWSATTLPPHWLQGDETGDADLYCSRGSDGEPGPDNADFQSGECGAHTNVHAPCTTQCTTSSMYMQMGTRTMYHIVAQIVRAVHLTCACCLEGIYCVPLQRQLV